MSNRTAVKKWHVLVGVAALSVGGAGVSVFHSVLSSDTYAFSAANSISVKRSLPTQPVRTSLNDYAGALFTQSGKQDRADYTARMTAGREVPSGSQNTPANGYAGQKAVPIIAASFTPVDMIRGGPTRFAGSIRQDVNRGSKSDRLSYPQQVAKNAPANEELNGPGMSAAMFMLSSTSKVGNTETATGEAKPVEAKPAGGSSWDDLIKLARVTGGDGEKIKAGIFGNLTEQEFRAREFRCMATAIYHEARGESIEGQTAVGQVIMNRVRSDYYPNTICGVVFQGQWNRNACQFSFACDGRTDTPKNRKLWKTSVDVAKKVISGESFIKEIAEATHYHATYVSPKWRKEMTRIKRIGVHIFYKAPFVRPLVASSDYDQL